MKKRRFAIIISVIAFLLAVLLGMNTVFSVSSIEYEFDVSSSLQTEKTETLKTEIEKAYSGKNILFVSESEIKDKIQSNPYLKVSHLEKRYPDKLYISVRERLELLAVKTGENEYKMLDVDGATLRIANSNQNNLDGAENVLLNGFTVQKLGDKYASSMATLAQMLKQMETSLNGVRKSISQISFIGTPSVGKTTNFVFYCKTGVEIHFNNPSHLTTKKAQKAMEEYFNLTDDQKLSGKLFITDDASNESNVNSAYQAEQN